MYRRGTPFANRFRSEPMRPCHLWTLGCASQNHTIRAARVPVRLTRASAGRDRLVEVVAESVGRDDEEHLKA